jgi:TPR repeat protein
MRRLRSLAALIAIAAAFGWIGYTIGIWRTEQALRDRGIEALKESRLRDAEHYYVALHSLGDRQAAFWLGEINVEGNGVPINHDRALFWFSRSTEPKPDLYVRLGHGYEVGDALPRNRQEALFWYHQAALLGSAEGKRQFAKLKLP